MLAVKSILDGDKKGTARGGASRTIRLGVQTGAGGDRKRTGLLGGPRIREQGRLGVIEAPVGPQ